MTSQTPRAFTFDTVFDGDTVVTAPRPKRTYTPEEVELVRAEAFAAGSQSATARAEAEAAEALAEVTRTSRDALSALTRIAHDHRIAAADLALSAARKIAGAALDAFPDAPAVAALSVLARDLEAIPRLLVTSACSDPARLEKALVQAAERAGFPGQIVLKVDRDLPPAAFVFDWGDGRAAFDPEAASERVALALTSALTAEGLHAEPVMASPPAMEA